MLDGNPAQIQSQLAKA